jgi:hypothetical protein
MIIPQPKPPRRLIPSTFHLSESPSDSFVEQITTPRTPSPVPKPLRCLIPSPAHLPESSTDSSVDETPIPSRVPRPP